MKLSEIIKVTNGRFIHYDDNGNAQFSIPDSQFINQLLIDSRKLISASDSIFFALVSARNNGHKYIKELYGKGVINFVVSERPENINEYCNCNFILVENTLISLQRISAYKRSLYTYPVVAITGSNGKTIVKEWLYHLLSPDKNILRSPKSYNSQIGVPLSVWQMDETYNMAIFEAGISEPNEMLNLRNIIKPDIGIFTNIGNAHSVNFIDQQQKINEKLILFTDVKTLIYCSDYKDISKMIFQTKSDSKQNVQLSLFSWSCKTEADLSILSIHKNINQTTITAKHKNIKNKIIIPFIDDASIENAIHCWAFMLLQAYDNSVIFRRMLTLSPVAMRLELKQGINNCSLINDYYNSDINSLSIALDFLNQQQQHSKRTVILSDILQSGKSNKELYLHVEELLKNKSVDRLIGIGEAVKQLRIENGEWRIEKNFYDTTEGFLNHYSPADFNNETILLKGARAFKFELISNLLQQKTHQTRLEINLSALISNLNFYRSLLKPQTKIAAMVKAFSYGSGSYEIANVLQYHNIDYLAVAYTDEGIELRKAGITVPIIVMNPEDNSFDLMIKHNLEPEIYSLRTLNQLILALKLIQHSTFNIQNYINIHIKLDTGMNRLGFETKDIAELIDILKQNTQIKLKSVFSHLATSYDTEQDEFTLGQIELFKVMSKQLLDSLDYTVIRHILNTAGLVRFPEAQFDMVRLGIGLYGIPTLEPERKHLQQVGSLKTIISQIRTIRKGESVGYGRQFIAQHDSVIAVIPIGYADGLSRRLSNGIGKVMVKGKLVPIIGNICMDMCVIDISDISANEGDEVIVFGPEYSVENLSKQLDTIPYEVLTSVSGRVKRVFFEE